MKTKKDREYSFTHSQERALERYGMRITRQEWESLGKACNESNLVSTERQDKTTVQTTHLLPFRGLNIRVVFENKRNCVTTILPLQPRAYI